MKVTEILSESRILNEQLNLFLKAITAAAERGSITAIEDALLWLGKALSSKGAKTAVGELAEGWVKTAEITGSSLDEIVQLGRAQAAKGGVDKAVLDAAEKEAQVLFKARQPAAPGLVATAKSKAQAGKAWFGKNWESANNLLLAWGIADPVLDCVYYINQAYEKQQSGDPEFQGAKLQYAVQYEINECVTRVAGLLVGSKLVKGIFGPNGIQRLPFAGGPKMATMFNGLGEAGKTAFMAWMMTDEGRKAFANWLVGNSAMPFGPTFAWVTSKLSEIAKTGYDHIMRFLGNPNAGAAPDPDKDFFTTSGDAQKRPQTSYNLGRGQALN